MQINLAAHADAFQTIEDALEELKQANGGSDVEIVKTAIENLNKAWEPIAQKMHQAAQQEAQTASNGSEVKTDSTDPPSGNGKKEEVEDADFEVVEDEK